MTHQEMYDWLKNGQWEDKKAPIKELLAQIPAFAWFCVGARNEEMGVQELMTIVPDNDKDIATLLYRKLCDVWAWKKLKTVKRGSA